MNLTAPSVPERWRTPGTFLGMDLTDDTVNV